MSYEILLFPRQPDQDWDAVLVADEADTPEEVLADENALAEGVATFRRIESRLQRFLTGGSQTWVAEETGGDVLGEFVSTDTGLQVELYHGSASVSFPYRPVDNLAGLHIKVREAVRIVAEETGYEAYDAQTRASFDGTVHDAEGRAAALLAPGGSEGMDVDGPHPSDGPGEAGRIPDGGAGTDLAPPSEAPVVHPVATDPADVPADDAPEQPLSAREQRLQALMEARRDPKKVRRRAFFDLALAAAIIVWVAFRRSAGETGFLTTVLMILAVMNLASGLLALRAAGRLEKEQAEGGQPGTGQPPTTL